MNHHPLSNLPLARRGAVRPAALGAALIVMVGLALIAPAAWTAIQQPGNAPLTSAGPDCRARAETTAEPREVTNGAQFMQWAMAAHRSAASPASFTTLAAARALSLDARN